MKKKNGTYPQIFRGQLWKVAGEPYELVDIMVTDVESPNKFKTIAFFSSKEPMSGKPYFGERIETILSDPAFERPLYWGPAELHDWLQKVPGGVSVRLSNVLWNLCQKGDALPLEMTREEFLALANAGEKTWQEFERAKELNSKDLDERKKQG